MAGPGYGGFFLKGLASGLQSGISMGTQIIEMKWKKDQRKKLEEKEKKIEEGMLSFRNLIREYGADKVYSDEEIMQLDTAFMASMAEVQAVHFDALNNIKTGNKRKLEEDFQLLDLVVSGIDGLNPGDAQGIFDTVEGWVQTEKGKNYFSAYKEIHRKRYEATQAKPTAEVFTTAEAAQRAYPGQGFKYSADAGGYVPTFREPEAPPTELGKMEETKKWLDSAYATGNAAYFNRIAKERGSPATFETYKQEYKKPEITPEGEITAGEKRTWDMASSVLFGSSDFVTGISKPGIISSMISSKLNMGQTLTDEESTKVRNNYNSIKGTLPSEVLSIVESQLKRYGISLMAPTITPKVTQTPEVTPQPGILQRGIDKVKSVISGGPDMKPIWGLEGQPTGEIPKEVPPMKVPTGAKEAMIPMMTKKELHDALSNTDRSDPFWDLLYAEAVKRGYITE